MAAPNRKAHLTYHPCDIDELEQITQIRIGSFLEDEENGVPPDVQTAKLYQIKKTILRRFGPDLAVVRKPRGLPAETLATLVALAAVESDTPNDVMRGSVKRRIAAVKSIARQLRSVQRTISELPGSMTPEFAQLCGDSGKLRRAAEIAEHEARTFGEWLRRAGEVERRVPEMGVLAVARPVTTREYDALARLLAEALSLAGKNKQISTDQLRLVRRRHLLDKPTP